jgi:hypothetical protein
LAEFAFAGLVNVVTKMDLFPSVNNALGVSKPQTNKEVYIVFPGGVSVCIEISILPVRARKDSEGDLRHIIVMVRARLGPAKWALIRTATDIELIVVLGEWS